jgi:hypothetical protein
MSPLTASQLITWTRVLHKLTVAHLVTKFLAFYETRKVIIVTVTCVPSLTHYSFTISFNIILPRTLRLHFKLSD